ncbi:MAG: FMN-binding protein [Candidatus Omnitrophica bacterium]|nr:FMN-binding protein [Candidatus Omnitrophota bacterium]
MYKIWLKGLTVLAMKYRILFFLFLIIFLGGLKVSWQRAHAPQKNAFAIPVTLENPLSTKFETSPFPYYKIFSADKSRITGYIFQTSDLTTNIKGYGGPVKMVISIDTAGRIKNIDITENNETPDYTGDLNVFTRQFLLKSHQNPLILGKDIDGITGATVSSEAITRTIKESLERFSKEILNTKSPSGNSPPQPFPWAPIIITFLLFLTAIVGIVWVDMRLRWLALICGFIYLGLITHTMLSLVQVSNVSLLNIPDFLKNPLWALTLIPAFIATLIIGRIYCGSLCPFAFPQEVMAKLFLRKKPPAKTISPGADSAARLLKYLFLFIILGLSIIFNNASAANMEPFVTLFSGHGEKLTWGFLFLLFILAIFHYRFWCKYLCPVGALTGLTARISLFKIQTMPPCSCCGICAGTCPVEAIGHDKEKHPVIDQAECILCGKCIQACPEKKLKLSCARYPMGPENIKPAQTQNNKRSSDALFLVLTASAAIFLAAIINDNILKNIQSSNKIKTSSADVETPSRSEAIKKQFESKGLPLHEGKYWKVSDEKS